MLNLPNAYWKGSDGGSSKYIIEDDNFIRRFIAFLKWGRLTNQISQKFRTRYTVTVKN